MVLCVLVAERYTGLLKQCQRWFRFVHLDLRFSLELCNKLLAVSVVWDNLVWTNIATCCKRQRTALRSDGKIPRMNQSMYMAPRWMSRARLKATQDQIVCFYSQSGEGGESVWPRVIAALLQVSVVVHSGAECGLSISEVSSRSGQDLHRPRYLEDHQRCTWRRQKFCKWYKVCTSVRP